MPSSAVFGFAPAEPCRGVGHLLPAILTVQLHSAQAQSTGGKMAAFDRRPHWPSLEAAVRSLPLRDPIDHNLQAFFAAERRRDLGKHRAVAGDTAGDMEELWRILLQYIHGALRGVA